MDTSRSLGHRFLALCASAFLLPAAILDMDGDVPRLRVERGTDGFEVRIDAGDGFEVVIDGVTLVLAGSDGVPHRIEAKWETATCARGTWSLAAPVQHEHDLRLEVGIREPSIVHVRLTDRLEVATSVQELSLTWRDAGTSAVEWRLPYFTEEADDIAPDVTWSLPAAVGHAGDRYVSIEPTLDGFARRLPMFFGMSRPATSTTSSNTDKSPDLVFGLGNFATRAGSLFVRRGNRTTTNSDELILEHDLRFGRATRLDEAVAEVAAHVWPAESHPQDSSIRRRMDATVAEAASRLVAFRERYAYFASTNALHAIERVAVGQDRRQRPLTAALAVFESALKSGDGPLRELARGVCRLFLDAPERGGLFRTHVVLDHASGRLQWEFDERGCYSTQDCSLVAQALLEWSDLDAELRATCLTRAQKLGDFLVRNRQADGSIPARFDPELDGYRDALWTGSGETATCGRFLLDLWRRIPDPRYLDAAKRAHESLVANCLGKGTSDRETARLFGTRSTTWPLRTSMTVIDAARLAFALADVSQSETTRARGSRWLQELLPLQQHWDPPFFNTRLRGGFMHTNFDSLWSDLHCIEAAGALWDAWRATFDIEYLERSAAALRAPFAHKGRGWGEQGLDHEVPLPLGSADRAAAVAVATSLLEKTGDAVIDVQTLRGVAFGDCSVTSVDRNGSNTIEVGLEKAPIGANNVRRADARVRFVRATHRTIIACNGVRTDAIDPRELDVGVVLPARNQLAVDFRPQPSHARERDLIVRARVSGTSPDATVVARAEIRVGVHHEDIPMRILQFDRETGIGSLTATIDAAVLETAKLAEVRISVQIDNRTIESPWRSIRIGDSDVADCGDDDERWLEAVGSSTTAPFADGTGRGRFLDGRELDSMTYALPVDPHSLTVRVLLRSRGRGFVEDENGTRLAAIRSPADAQWSEHEFFVRERALFEQGRLRLRFVSDRDSFGVDWIEFEAFGRGTPASTLGTPMPAKKLEELVIGVLPTATIEPPTVTIEDIRLAVFADDTFRRPAGSLAGWLKGLSRQRFELRGDIEPWRTCRRPDEAKSQAAWLSSIFDAHDLARYGRATPMPDMWLVLHTGLPQGVFDASTCLSHANRPVLVVQSSGQRGNAVPLADAARAFWSAQTPRFGRSETRVFDDIVLGDGATKFDTPKAPLGLALHALGWVERILVSPTNHASVLLPPLTTDGFILSLPIPGFANELVQLELRDKTVTNTTNGTIESSTRELLGYWSLPTGTIALRTAEARASSVPDLLPLRASTWSSSGIENGPSIEPVRGTRIVTARGEECWSIDRMRMLADGVAMFDLTFLGQRLLDSEGMLVLSQPAGVTTPVLLTIGGPRGSSGVISKQTGPERSALRIECPPRKSSRIRLSWDGVASRSGSRLVGRIATSNTIVRVLLGDDKREIFVASFGGPGGSSDSAMTPFVATLPGTVDTDARVTLEFEALESGDCTAVLDTELMSWPLTPAAVECTALAAEHVERRAILAGSGELHAPTVRLGERETDRIELPLRIPDVGTLLRIDCSLARAADAERLPEGATSTRSRRLRVRFRDPRASLVATVVDELIVDDARFTPMCIDLEPLRGRTGILVLEAIEAGPAAYFTEASLRYR
ncbi:MAG: hypothetical protein H6834_00665 [Planctomycetes bacterium]|nr:hypothetical protein [Planctomycetota bacterium]